MANKNSVHNPPFRTAFLQIINSPPLFAKRSRRAPHSLFPGDTIAHTMIAFDIISGEYRDCSDSLEYIDRQRSAFSEKELSLIALGIIAATPTFASQQSASQGLY
ncbi:hypothetical protein LNO81_24995 [Klebsiella variicola subsp. variicola]|nr:hypothetical protein [Klebsiella variicola subsp. variicola]